MMQPYYEQDGITIYHGDCRDVLATIDPGTIGALVTDPPYGRAFATNFMVRGKGASWLGTTIQGDEDTAARDALIAWGCALPMLVFGSWKVQRPKDAHTLLIWDKGPAFGMGDLSIPWKPSFDEIYVLGRGFAGSRDEGVVKGFTGVSWESAGRAHPNEKPVKLLRYLIGKCPPGVILDPFMGSGTTLRAAKDLGRRAIGIELEERYCEIAARRLSQSVLNLDGAA